MTSVKWLILAGSLFMWVGASFSQNFKSDVKNSKHDFSVASTATIHAVSETALCVFCHTPHNVNPTQPLWNHTPSAVATYALYSSSTLRSIMGQPTAADSSKLCLSCHDGTVALGDTVKSGMIPFVQGPQYMIPPTSRSNLYRGVGFLDQHPFAFIPSIGQGIQAPPPGDPVRFDANGKVQCISCHNPHAENKDSTVGRFLVKSNVRSAICLTCHLKDGWTGSAHRQPVSAFDDGRYGPLQGAHTGYTGVSNNGCESCHRPHAPSVAQRLTKYPEEQVCFKCHDGSVADTLRNIQAVFQNKMYRHPVLVTPSVHDASEGPTTSLFRIPETDLGAARHSECADCHNPHAANSQIGTPPLVSGFLSFVKGFTSAGTGTTSAQYAYEICFKCHSDSANKPQATDRGTVGVGYGRNPQRLTDQANPTRYNTRMEFNSIVAFHPVVAPRGLSSGLSGEIPSLRAAPIYPGGAPIPGRVLSPSSQIYCHDCHNNDTGRNLGVGTEAWGSHGSNMPHMLERTNVLEPPPLSPGAPSGGMPYSLANYALCDKCHDIQNSTLRDQSFKYHNKHIVGVNAACSTCHDPHGINGGTALNNSRLINFDLSIVGPNSAGQLKFEKGGFRSGACFLKCHGEDHSPKNYP
ncbi:MAG: hypothetical protein HYR55_10745 [Acidobacteria bacterium]|nr:hypothetical protein [Acidobacteriota bacterium]MBI3655761.1 hypothetical protein [Acidobacteriota bacterium]